MADVNQTTTAPPIYDYADDNSLIGLLRMAFRSEKLETDDMLPATVVGYNRSNNTVTLQPAVKILTTDNKLISKSQYINIPVFAYGGGGFVINFPLQLGDKGWIKACDRDISLYTQSLLESGPNTFRLHSFEDGLFIPDIVTGFTVAAGDAARMVIQSLDGTTKLAMGSAYINLTVPGSSFIMNGGAITIASTTLTHNGVDIGSTHAHQVKLVTAGSATIETTPPNV